MAKKYYTITMPLTGIVSKEVEAESEEEALKIFHEDLTIDDIQEWETCEHIVQGNVFYGIQNTMEIEEGDEVEE